MPLVLMVTFEIIVIVLGVLLLVSVLASKASGRLGVPALLLFLLIGMLAGSEGPGGIYFDDAELAQWLGVLTLIFILFSGGLDTAWSFVRPVLWRALLLSTLGVAVTAFLVGWFSHVFLGLPLVQGLLLGAIVSSTDAAAVFVILRSRGIILRKRTKSILELESGSNDPMAVFLTISLLELIQNPDMEIVALIPMFFHQMGFGLVLGLIFGWLTVELVNRINLEYDGLYPAITTASVLLTFGATNVVGGSGFLAVYVAGLLMGNRNFVHRRTLARFHDGIAWLMQIAMFLALGLLVFPSELVSVVLPGLALAAFLMFVARPMAVFLCLAFSKASMRGRILIGWIGLRGAVPIILATFPLLAGIPLAATMFNLIFFVVFASVLLQGTSIPFAARRLGVRDRAADPEPAGVTLPTRPQSDLVTMEARRSSPIAGRQIVYAGLPKDTLILLIFRGNEFFTPNGRTLIHPGDRLIILTSKRSVDAVRERVEGPPENSADHAGSV
jgi:potassium/hydrogen antiporter